MVYQANVLNVMIASPKDVSEEREIVRSEIAQWNAAHSRAHKIILNAIGWDTDSVPLLGQRTQSLLNKQLCDISDFAIAIFHTRLGTNDENGIAGTQEEIEYMLNADRRVLLYKSTKPLKQENVDLDQLKALETYLSSIEHLGVRQDFENNEQLRGLLQRQISQTIHDFESGVILAPELGVQSVLVDLSAAAKWILKTAASGDGNVVFQHFGSGSAILAGGVRQMCDIPREVAKVDYAIKELESFGFLDQRSEHLYKLTSPGFEYYETVKDNELWQSVLPPFPIKSDA